MFRCAEGHVSNDYEDRKLLPVKVRLVETQHFIDHDKGEKNIFVVRSVGTEIIEEKAYCPKHASIVEPEVVGKHLVTHRFKSRLCERPDKKRKIGNLGR